MNNIDVLLPVYNSERFVEKSVRSVQEQTYKNINIIVVDDGSTDSTFQILKRIAREDSRVHVISQKNTGIVGALERALRASSATIIARQDADDISYPDRFEKQIAYLDVNPACVAVSGEAIHIDVEGQKLGTVSRMPPLSTADPDWVPAREPYLMHPFLMARRSAIDQVGGYRHFLHCEDVDLYWRLRSVGELNNLPEILGEYRFHASLTGGSIQNARLNAIFMQLAAISEKRRRGMADDIAIGLEYMRRFKVSMTMTELVETACYQLNSTETEWFRAACGARLLQLIELRRFRPDKKDCLFLKDVYPHNMNLCFTNRKELSRLYSVQAARFLREFNIIDAVLLVPLLLIFPSIVRAVLNRGI